MDRKSFAFSGGKFVGGELTVVDWAPGWYNDLGEVQVPSDVPIQEELLANINALLLGSYNENVLGTELVNVQH